MSFFQGSSNVSIHNSIFNEIHGNATIVRFGDSQFTQDQKIWIADYISSHAILPDINDNLNRNFLTQLIINLPRAEAMFNDYQTKKKSGPCFEGTRVALLWEMANWVTGTDESRMYILSGLAGIGKSTVAYTIASRAADLNLLGASFFFSRDEAERNNAKKFFTTIAYQLCVYNETFANAIGDALRTERGSAATTKDPQEQLKVLILDPIRSIVRSHARPILVVVDALDECVEDDEQAVINGLSQLVRSLPWFKVILTTRPIPNLDYLLGCQDGHKLFRLQDIEDKVVDGDIWLYLKHNLSLEQVRKCCPMRHWCANDEEIDSLVHAAGRLFIIASTAVRYILDKYVSNPAARIQYLLRAFAQGHTPLKDLDHFYTVILQSVVPVDCDNDDVVSRYQSVVGTIIFVQEPLPVSILARLINTDVEEIRVVLSRLQSVILLGDDDVPRIYHKSFPDYITDQARCKDLQLQIDPNVCHTRLASRCFKISNKHLKYNILGLGKIARYMNNEDSLNEDGITDQRLQKKIPKQLRYACIYWANHLQIAMIENADLMNRLAKFLKKHTLHWFEVLSLIGKLDSAPRALHIVLKHLTLTSSDLHQLLSATSRFLSKFYGLIEQSALHTYYSALPFSPTDSLFYQRFIKEARHNVFTIEGGPEKWDALVATPSHGQETNFIKFSPDSTLFFSSSAERVKDGIVCNEGRLKIWDATTGTPISTIRGQNFAVTNDLSTIASSEDNTVTYYNTNGSTKGTICTVPSDINVLALSSDGGRLAAALSDGSVWLWEGKNAKLIDNFDEFKGGEDRVCLQLSPTGTRLAYWSGNGIIKLRDGTNGRFISDLHCKSRSSLAKLVFSEDSSRIACLSFEHHLSLWNSKSGRLIDCIRLRDDDAMAFNLAISANGSLLATIGHNRVTLWSGKHNHLARIKTIELDSSDSIAFSMHNILAIGRAFVVNLYNVETHSFISTFPTISAFPEALAFSPDCTRFAYGDSKLCLWDIQGIDASKPPSKEATAVVAIDLSRDCSHLACGYQDGRVELWVTSPTVRRISSYQAHAASAMIQFGLDGRLFASGSYYGTIKLWNGNDGSLCRTAQLHVPSALKKGSGGRTLEKLALSNQVLISAGIGIVTLWSPDILDPIHTFRKFDYCFASSMSISDDSDLAAVCFLSGHHGSYVDLLDVVNYTTIATFKVSDVVHKLTFLPDKSHLVAQLRTGSFASFNLITKRTTEGPTSEHLIQLPGTPLWHGVPIWYCRTKEQDCFLALFSQHTNPVPVLWIPGHGDIMTCCAEGSSMIALSIQNGGRIILLRLPTSHVV